MALIELATNHDVNAIVEAIRSLRQENDTAIEFAKSFVIPFASAFGGAFFAYQFQNRSLAVQNQVQRLGELNTIAQELNRLSMLLINHKIDYYDTISPDPFVRVAVTKGFNITLAPPRFYPSGQMILNIPMPEDRTLTIATVETIFTNYASCFRLWAELNERHHNFSLENCIERGAVSVEEYALLLKGLAPLDAKEFVQFVDQLLDLTDSLLVESYYANLALMEYCQKTFNHRVVKEAHGIYKIDSSGISLRAKVLELIPLPDTEKYKQRFKYTPYSDIRLDTMTPPTAMEIESAYETDSSA